VAEIRTIKGLKKELRCESRPLFGPHSGRVAADDAGCGALAKASGRVRHTVTRADVVGANY
jgi:hypothetical protein